MSHIHLNELHVEQVAHCLKFKVHHNHSSPHYWARERLCAVPTRWHLLRHTDSLYSPTHTRHPLPYNPLPKEITLHGCMLVLYFMMNKYTIRPPFHSYYMPPSIPIHFPYLTYCFFLYGYPYIVILNIFQATIHKEVVTSMTTANQEAGF